MSENSDKQELPPGWIVKNSKRHPEKVLYFNVKTQETLSTFPTIENVKTSKEKKSKRKIAEVQDEDLINTSTMGTDSSVDFNTSRVKLKAKRTNKTESTVPVSVDTPAMRLYREKKLQREAEIAAKKNAPKTSQKTVTKTSPVKKKPRRLSRASSSSSDVDSSITSNILDTKMSARNKSDITPQKSEALEQKNLPDSPTKIPETAIQSRTSRRSFANDRLQNIRNDISKNISPSSSNLVTKIKIPKKTKIISSPTLKTTEEESLPCQSDQLVSSLYQASSSRKSQICTNNKLENFGGETCSKELCSQNLNFKFKKLDNSKVTSSISLETSVEEEISAKQDRSPFMNQHITPNKSNSFANDRLKSFQDKTPTIKSPSETNPELNKSKIVSPLISEKSMELKISPEKSTIITSRKSQTFANDRLKNLRKSLNESLEPNQKRSRLSQLNNNSIASFKNNKDKEKFKNLNNKIEPRLSLLAKTDYLQTQKKDEICTNIENTSFNDDEMEWEPIEDEMILSEVQSARLQICENPVENVKQPSTAGSLPLDTSVEQNTLYIVIDTNVFLSNLQFIEEIRDISSAIYGKPYLVIPWTVLQELDYIKDDNNNTKSKALQLKARKAIDFLNKQFTRKHPRFLGQSPAEVKENEERFRIECPDDKILQTCLQIRSTSNSVVLLTYDKNLCNKALIHDITTLSKDEPFEKIDYIKAAETKLDISSNNLQSHFEQNQEEIALKRKELLVSDDIFEEGKAVLKSILSEVVALEMENLFGSVWEKHVIIRPPWSIGCVIKCALKHWMAAVSESFSRKGEIILRDIQISINNTPLGGRRLPDVMHFLDKCNDLIQTLIEKKHGRLKAQSIQSIEALQNRCQESMNELTSKKQKEDINQSLNNEEEELKAQHAFSCFEEVYSFARDTCGIAAETIGIQCSFLYNKSHPYLNSLIVSRICKDVAISVTQLSQALATALVEINSEADINNDKALNKLCDALINFSPELNLVDNQKLTPLDIYYCIKWKKNMLTSGLNQLHELTTHFCQMANVVTS